MKFYRKEADTKYRSGANSDVVGGIPESAPSGSARPPTQPSRPPPSRGDPPTPNKSGRDFDQTHSWQKKQRSELDMNPDIGSKRIVPTVVDPD